MNTSSAPLSPVDGGCWFCSRAFIESDGWMFSTEFDCYLHESCLLHAVLTTDNPEARIMAREFREPNGH